MQVRGGGGAGRIGTLNQIKMIQNGNFLVYFSRGLFTFQFSNDDVDVVQMTRSSIFNNISEDEL